MIDLFFCKSCFLLLAIAVAILDPTSAQGWVSHSSIIQQKRRIGRLEVVLQRGHSSEVDAFAFSQDGELLATGSQDWTVKTWNLRTGELIYSLPIDGSWHYKLAFSPDSKTLAVFIRFGRAQIRNAHTGALLRTLYCGSEPAGIVFSPDNSTLGCGTVGGSDGGSITLWNYHTGQRMRSMKAHGGGGDVGVVAFSRDGRIVASAEGGPFGVPIVELWNVATGARMASIQARGEVDSCAFSPDGKTLAIGAGRWLGEHPAVELWDLKRLTLRQRLLGHNFNILWVTFSKDGSRIVSGDSQGVFKQWNPASGKELRRFGHPHPWEHVAISPGARLAAEPDNDGSVRIFDVESGRTIRVLPGVGHQVNRLAYMEDGLTLAVSTGNPGSEKSAGEVHFLDVRTGAWRGALTGMPGDCTCLGVSRDGKVVAASGQDGLALLWNRVALSYSGQTGVSSHRILSLALTSDGSLLASAGEKPKPKDAKIDPHKPDSNMDPVLDLWDTHTRTLLRSLQGHTSPVTSVVFSADGNTLYSLGYDSQLILWDTHTGTIRRTISTKDTNGSLAVDRAEAVAAVGGDTSSLRTFDLRTGQPIHAYDTHYDACQVAISPAGRIVASGDTQGVVWLWQTSSGQLLRRLQGVNLIKSMQFSPDGTTLATVDGEAVVKLWDVATGRLKARLAILGGSGADSTWITFTPEGYYEGSPDIERTIHWNLNGDVFPANRFQREFRQPAHVQTALSGAAQAALYGHQIEREAELRHLIRNQKVVIQRDQSARTKLEDSGTKYLGVDSDLYKSLTTSVSVGNAPLMERLHKQIKDQIAAGANPNVQGRWGKSALMFMAWYGDREAIEGLLKRGADINAVDAFGSTPLLQAVSHRNKDIVQLLLDRGADLKDADGKSLLKFVGDKTALGRALVAILQPRVVSGSFFGADLHIDYLDTTWMLLSWGADPNLRDGEGRTPLVLLPIFQADSPVLTLLLEKGADVNAMDNQGNSALSYAARQGRIEVVRFLLDHGAKASEPVGTGGKSLMNAAYDGHTEIVRLLLDRGADPNTTNASYYKTEGSTALMAAVQGGHIDIVTLLLDRGAQVNATAIYGHWTALTLACIRGDAELVKLLLARGANVNVRTDDGLSLLQLLPKFSEQANDRFGIITLLKKAGEKE
jgi:WD40 repeat protein/ankyrin repeat protein